ncbi:MAG: hypothetical protein LW698_00050 [Planctomycetaceae bacterium]|jgi:hypothetical protein|nr:hypothetical protein [Planctomycetaceae bacterium]
MTEFQGFRFFTTPWTLGVSLALIAITAAICVFAWKRSGYAPGQGLLELLRLAIVGLVAILLNQPEWVEEYRPADKPTIAVLHDASRSMDTRDVVLSGTAARAGGPQTRREAIAELITSDFWKPLAERFNVEIAAFSPAPDAAGTDYAAPLGTVLDRFVGLRSVVLVGDGDWNEGPAPSTAAQALRLAQVPVVAVAVGSETKLPDVEFASLDCPTVGVAGKPVRVPFTIHSSLSTERVVVVDFKASNGDALRKEVRLPAMGTATDWLYWTPRDVGDYTVTITVPKQDGELLADNNQRTAPIAVRREQLKVLVVESIPRWEYRYLRNALSRDPGVDVTCLLFQPGLSKRGGGNKDYIQKFPSGLDALSQYDVVFLGDVGVSPDQLTEEDCRLLKGLVEYQASGLVFLPGWRGEQASLMGTALEELCPVVLDPVRKEGFSSEGPRKLVLTEVGRKSLLTKLADSGTENLAVWESLPGVQWYGPVLRAKAGSEVLAVHEDAGNEYGRIPLLITRTYGAGKVLYMATDGAWRWRKGVEDKYHYRFWGQVVRWMAYRRNMAKGERMSLSFAPEQPQLGQALALDARVAQANGEPLSRGEVAARVKAPSGTVETVRFAPPAGEGEWGVFAANLTPREPGKHEVTLVCKETGDTLEASFFVQGSTAEGIGRAARPEVLAEIAQVTKGRLVPPGEIASIIESLAKLPEPPPSVRRLQLWCHPAAAGVIVGLLGLFWVMRKRQGLV